MWNNLVVDGRGGWWLGKGVRAGCDPLDDDFWPVRFGLLPPVLGRILEREFLFPQVL